MAASLLVGSASAAIVKWEVLWGTSGFDVATDIAVDGESIYVTGLTKGGPKGWDSFIASFDFFGVLKWEWFWGTSGFDYALDIAVDRRGNIYITGYTSPGPLGDEDAFIVSFDSSGVLLWESFWGTAGDDRALGIAVDDDGNVYVAGRAAEGDVGWDAFVASFDPLGVLRWQNLWNMRLYDVAYDVALDVDGNVYIAGGTAPTESGVWDAVIVSYGPHGVFRWQTLWGAMTLACDWVEGVALDRLGNVYVAGTTFIFGPYGEDDAFVASFNSSGALMWNVWWGTSGIDYATDVAVDITGNVYITGYTSPGPSGGEDAFVASFDSSGALLWQAWWGTSGLDRALGVAVDERANIYVTGYTAPSVSGDYRAFLLGVSHLVGDINDDDRVNDQDLILLSQAFGSTGGPPPSANWESKADLNEDNIIDVQDLLLLGENYGKTA